MRGAGGGGPRGRAGDGSRAVLRASSAGPPQVRRRVAATSSPTSSPDSEEAYVTTHPTVPRSSWLALGAVLLAGFLHTFDVTVVSIAAPSIQDGLGASDAAVQWLLAGYSLAFALLLVTAGRLGDAYGRRPLVLWGIIAFTLASALCAAAPNAGVLIAARVLQGLSAALLAPQIAPVIILLFPKERRGAAFGVQAAVIAAATCSGPVLGGLLAHADLFGLGWRAVFLVNLPVGALALLLAAYGLPAERSARGARAPRLDLVGVAVATAGLLLLLVPLVQGRESGRPLLVMPLAVAGIVVLALLVPLQRRAERAGRIPLLAPGLFRDRAFPAGAAVNFLVMGAVASFFLVYVVHLQEGLGFTAKEAGFALLPFALSAAFASAASVPLTGRLGRPMLECGALLMALGTGVLLWLTVAQGDGLRPAHILPGLVLCGAGMGLLSPPLYNITLSAMSRGGIGSASGVFSTFGQIGNAVGVAVVGTVFYGLAGGASGSVTAVGWALGCQLALYVLALALLRLGLPRPAAVAGSAGSAPPADRRPPVREHLPH
ncbi:MFS transporter [Streptomyces hirsutus]|uniref:MFS transporter n=1 Tax=Streptomyces hirsutus TaxID=35620 RepID=UPI00368ECA2E